MAWHPGDRANQQPRIRALVPVILLGLIGSFVLIGSRPVAAAPPSNDVFATATVLVGDSGSLVGTNVDASGEVGEPAHGGFGPARSVRYDWTAAATGNAVVDLEASQCCTDDLHHRCLHGRRRRRVDPACRRWTIERPGSR